MGYFVKFYLASCCINRENVKLRTVILIVDARLNTNVRALSSTIIDYHQPSCSLGMFKFDLISD